MTRYRSSVHARRNPAGAARDIGNRIQPAQRPGTTRQRRHWLSAIVLPFLLAGVGTGLVPRMARAAGGTDSTCTQASIQSDLNSGGTWTLDCAASTTIIPFSTAATFNSGTAALQVASGKHVILDGGHSTRLFTVTGGTLSLSGLTLQHGSAPYAAGARFPDTVGGAILNNGTLHVSNSTFTANNGGSGGAIFNYYNNGMLSVTNSTFTANSAGSGGAITNYANYNGSLDVSGSTFSANNGGSFGGAIFNQGPLRVLNSTFTGNSAPSPEGLGGAIDTNTGHVSVSNSTISGNSAGFGGAIAIDSTFTGNNGGTSINVRNSIIANNSCDITPSATITDLGYNLEYQGGGALTCGFTNHAVNNQDPLLGFLQDNGGPTQTMALGAGSPAIDAVPQASCVDATGTPLTTDQRDFTRPDDSEAVCDIGAYESAAPTTLLFSDGFESGNFGAWNSVQTNAGGSAVVESYLVSSGQHATRLSATSDAGSYVYIRKILAAPQTDLTVSGDFNVRAQGAAGSTVPLFRLFDGVGNLVVSLYRLNLTNGDIWVQHSGAYHRTTGMLPLKTWGHLALHVITNGANHSTVEVSLNGTPIYSVQGASLGTAEVQTLQIGNEAHQQVFDLVADNIVAQ